MSICPLATEPAAPLTGADHSTIPSATAKTAVATHPSAPLTAFVTWAEPTRAAPGTALGSVKPIPPSATVAPVPSTGAGAPGAPAGAPGEPGAGEPGAPGVAGLGEPPASMTCFGIAVPLGLIQKPWDWANLSAG